MLKFISPVLVVALLLSIASCKEQPVAISHATQGADSTYVTTPESPQPKKVLATELTGVQCPNCPSGAATLRTLSEQNGDALIVIGLHAGTLTQPLDKEEAHSKYDFRTEDGDDILNQVFGGDPNGKPAVAYNRMRIGTNGNPFFIQSYAQNWGPKLQDALTSESPVLINVTVSSQYNTATDKYDLEAKVAYNQEVSGKQRLNLYLTQDSIIDVQETSNPFNQFDQDYVFMHVFRQAITGISGQPVLDSLTTKEAGRVFIFRTSLSLTPPPNQDWHPEHMHVVAFVSEASGEDIHVYQSAQTPLVKP